MRAREKGFTLIELAVSVAIMVLAGGGASIAIFQILKNNDRNTDQMTAAQQTQNAGDWISRDVQTALSITTTNLTAPVFLVLTWTDNVGSDHPVYNTTNYSIEGVSGGIGTLVRRHTNTSGVNEQTLIAQNVYYNLADSGSTTTASYQNPVLTVRIASRVGAILETRQYRVKRRPNTFG